MLCKVLLVSLVLAAVAVQVLLASVACASAGGSCEPMSISKALSDPTAGQLEHEVVHAVVERKYPPDTTTFNCPSPSDSLLEVKNLSVSLFPNAEYPDYYNLLLQWISDGNSEGYFIQLTKEGRHKFYNTQINNPMVTSVLLKEVTFYPYSPSSLSIQVQPKSRSSSCASVTVSVSVDLCDAFVYNQHCSQRVQQSTPDIAEFQVQTTLLSSDPQLMSMHLSWETRDKSVMIALTSTGQKNTDCSKPGRQPPCFIASNTNSVTVSSLNASTKYTVTLHIFDPSPCHPNLVHLLDGCSNGHCCNDYSPIPLPLPTNITSTYTTPTPSSVYTRVTTSQANSHTEDTHTEDTHTEDTHTEDTHTEDAHTEDLRAVYSNNISQDNSSGLVIVAIAVPLVIIVVSVCIIAVSVILYKASKKRKRRVPPTHVMANNPIVEYPSSTTTLPDIGETSMESLNNIELSPVKPLNSQSSPIRGVSPDSPSVVVLYSPKTPNTKHQTESPLDKESFLDSSSDYSFPISRLTHVMDTNNPIVEYTSSITTLPNIGETSMESLNNIELSPVKPLNSQSSPIRGVSPDSPSVVVLYSPKTPTVEIEDILGTLVVGLRQYGINAKSPDTCCVSDSISAWLEREVENSIVLLVCNEALKSDWECERPSKLVCSLRQLLHGSLVDRGLSKFATVFMGKDAESGYVPSAYLMPQNQFTVRDISDIDDISHFVFKIPRYEACYEASF